jgi:hypothetical protein
MQFAANTLLLNAQLEETTRSLSKVLPIGTPQPFFIACAALINYSRFCLSILTASRTNL